MSTIAEPMPPPAAAEENIPPVDAPPAEPYQEPTTEQIRACALEDVHRVLSFQGRQSKWAGIFLLLGIAVTAVDLIIRYNLLPGEQLALLSGSMPESALMRAGTVLFGAALIMLLLPIVKTPKENA